MNFNHFHTKVFAGLLLIFCYISPLSASECLEVLPCAATTIPYGLPDAEITAYPEPDVKPLFVDEDLLHDRFYQQTQQAIDIYDVPGGNVIEHLPDGFNFLTVLQIQNGWAEINRGQWVKSEYLANSNGIISKFSGVILPDEELPYQMGWILVNLYPSKIPGGNPSESNPLVWRYTRVNLYTSVEVDGFRWYQIGIDQWIHQFHVAKYIPVERPADVDTVRWISIDLYEQVVVAYEGNRPVFTTLVATGLDRWPTYEGLYHIYFRRLRDNMSGGVPGDDYYFLEEVPWTMFFDEGRALHGAYWHDGFGYRRSHGCVNLAIADAHWLYNWVAEDMGSFYSADKESGPAVFVHSSGVYS